LRLTDFGARFKKARESLGVSLDQIAIETRISTRFLKAIENEEFQLLPGGIFNRGFVRAYAERVGLDPDQAVADYERLSEYREPAETVTAPPAASRKTDKHLYPIVIGALALLIIVYYVMTRDSGSVPPATNTISEPAAPPPAPPETTSAASPDETEREPVPPPAPAAEPVSAEITATEPTWIKVVLDGNDAMPVDEILQPGTTRRFTAQTSMTLTIGNASGVTMRLNDKPMKPLGKPGQVREFVITPKNVDEVVRTGR
jgi:cytoskeleton protein RodZ